MMKTLLACLLVTVACQKDRSKLDDRFAPTSVVEPGAVAPPAPSPHAPAPAAAADSLSGTVVETFPASTYTYARLDHDGHELWLAGPETKLAIGAKIGPIGGTLMQDFHSDTLKRTFPAIYFVSSFGQPAVTGATAGSATEASETVARAPNGKTVAEIIASRATLEGKPVDVRGKVVKVTTGVLDRNWVHLRDGSGTAGSNDLMITTKEDVKVGEVVTAHGTVATNRDLGAGYHYDVLVENATLKR